MPPSQGLSYPRIASRLCDTPLAIEAGKLDALLAVLEPRLRGEVPAGLAWWDDDDDAPADDAPYALLDGGIAHVKVMGTLVQRSSGFDGWSGLTSYQGLAQTLDAAQADGRVRGLVLELDSSGGEVAGLFDFVDALRAFGQVKPVWAHVNESAFSAAYAIASAAEKVWLTRTAGVGSIGVVAVHLDRSGADKLAGLKFTYIYAGAHKVDFNLHQPLSDAAREPFQAEIDRVHDLFCATVARHRGLTVEAVRATEAGLFWGPGALEAGLADQVGTFDEAVAAFAARLGARNVSIDLPGGRRAAITPGLEVIMATDDDAPAKGQGTTPDTTAQAAGNVVNIDAARADGEARALAYYTEVNEVCALAGQPAKAAAFIAAKTPVGEVRKALLIAQADAADALQIAGQHQGKPPVAADAANNYGWDKAFAKAGVKLSD